MNIHSFETKTNNKSPILINKLFLILFSLVQTLLLPGQLQAADSKYTDSDSSCLCDVNQNLSTDIAEGKDVFIKNKSIKNIINFFHTNTTIFNRHEIINSNKYPNIKRYIQDIEKEFKCNKHEDNHKINKIGLIKGRITIEDSFIEGDITAGETKKKDKDSIESIVVFTKGVSFARTVFSKKANFPGTLFLNGAKFAGAKFENGANFYLSKFDKKSNDQEDVFYKRIAAKDDFDNSLLTNTNKNKIITELPGKQKLIQLNNSIKNFSVLNIKLNEIKDIIRAKILASWWSPTGADFSDAQFLKKVDFRKVEFANGVNFRNATFKEEADFWRAKFTGKGEFRKDDELSIEFYSTLDEVASWANFKNTRFIQKANFWDAEFHGGAYFWDTKFFGDCKFNSALFGIKSHYAMTHLNKENIKKIIINDINMKNKLNLEILDDLPSWRIKDTEYPYQYYLVPIGVDKNPEHVYFADTYVNNENLLKNKLWEVPMLCKNQTEQILNVFRLFFKKKVLFFSTVNLIRAYRVTIGESSRIKNLSRDELLEDKPRKMDKYKDDGYKDSFRTSFCFATFNKVADFTNALFLADTDFESAKFEGVGIFNDCSFFNANAFAHVNKPEGWFGKQVNESITFAKDVFYISDKYQEDSLVHLRMRDIYFNILLGLKFDQIFYNLDKWKTFPKSLDKWIYPTKEELSKKEVITHLIEIYKYLQENFKNIGRFKDANEIFYKRKLLERENEDVLHRKIMNNILLITCVYGTNFLWLGFMSVIFILIFACIYCLFSFRFGRFGYIEAQDKELNKKKFKKCLYFSFKNFTPLGTEDISANKFLRTLGLIESLLGWGILGLMIMTLVSQYLQ